MNNSQIKYLFFYSFLTILLIYSLLLGKDKIINIVFDQYELILTLIPISLISLFYKIKLKNSKIIDFNKDNNLSLKTTILIFLLIEIIDYIYENGFLGMISQWFGYWIMGVFTFMVLNIINYYRNYKLFITN